MTVRFSSRRLIADCTSASDCESSAAVELTKAIPEGQDRNNLVGALAHGWAAVDQQRAREWVLRLPEGPARDAGLTGVIQGIAQTSPQEAAQLFNLLPAGNSQLHAVQGVVAQWARIDPPAAAAWVSGLQNETVRQQVQSRIEQAPRFAEAHGARQAR